MTGGATNSGGRKRVLVTGGAGAVGMRACRALAKADEIDQVLVADRRRRRAVSVAADLGPKATALELDITDADQLGDALDGIDIVLNTAGPFHRFGREVLSAAIATGTHYLDICDDWQPTLDMLQLNDAARAAGVTAVLGMGSSPGTSNLLALLAMNQLDVVDRVATGCRVDDFVPFSTGDSDTEPSASLEHWIHNSSAAIKTWQGGREASTRAFEEVSIGYPGLGHNTAWVCGHPAPLTLPLARSEVRDSVNLVVARRELMDALQCVIAQVRQGDLDPRRASAALFRNADLTPTTEEPSRLPDLFAVAEGQKDGVPTRVGARPLALPSSSLGEMTGYPLAIATLMVAHGQVDRPGVHAAEGVIDPEKYFHELSLLVEDRPDGPVVDVATEAIA